MKLRFLHLTLLIAFLFAAPFRSKVMAQEDIDIEEAMRLEKEGKSKRALSM